MADPYAEFQQALTVNPYAEFSAPAPPDEWVKQRKAALAGLDERLGKMADETPGHEVVDPGGVGAVGHALQMGLTRNWQPKIEAGVTAGLGQFANALGGDEGSFGDIYQRELEKNRAEGERLKGAHPKLSLAADVIGSTPGWAVGGPIVGSALSGGLRAAGASENVAGEKGTNLRGAAETGGGAAAGALTAYMLPRALGELSGRFGNKADIAARTVVTGGTQTALDKFNKAMDPVRAMAPGGQFAPGEMATTLNELGAVGGLRGQRGTLQGIQNAKQTLGSDFGSLIKEAASKDPGVPLDSAKARLADVLEENQANSLIEREVDKAMGRLDKVAKDGVVPHDALQDVLQNMNKSASKIFPKAQKSEGEDAFLSTYRALRNVQADGLVGATGRNANDLRKYMAMTYALEPVAQKALNRLEGNDKVGLLGALEKQKGSTSIGHGILAFAMGQPLIGSGMVLKGALNAAKGQFGRSSSPMVNNLATSINLGLQKPFNALSQSELTKLLGAKLAAEYGAQGAGSLYDMEAPQQPEPEQQPPSVLPGVARRLATRKP